MRTFTARKKDTIFHTCSQLNGIFLNFRLFTFFVFLSRLSRKIFFVSHSKNLFYSQEITQFRDENLC